MKILLFFAGFILALDTYSQEKLFQVRRNVCEFVADTLYSQIDLSVCNTSDSTLVVWIEKNNIESLSVSQKIQNHFFAKKGDVSLMQMIWDGNVESFIPDLFESFLKVIKPKESFTISILKRGKINSGLIRSLENHIVVVNAGDIKGLQVDGNLEVFNYKSNNLIILFDWMK